MHLSFSTSSLVKDLSTYVLVKSLKWVSLNDVSPAVAVARRTTVKQEGHRQLFRICLGGLGRAGQGVLGGKNERHGKIADKT